MRVANVVCRYSIREYSQYAMIWIAFYSIGTSVHGRIQHHHNDVSLFRSFVYPSIQCHSCIHSLKVFLIILLGHLLQRDRIEHAAIPMDIPMLPRVVSVQNRLRDVVG
mmetsp:Transcript_13675/g.37632  ORF Transcript_13675/g.37632 Transcript_13675/m.37632 type:complete len:108 (-) Transcript_13675:495-818(-)